MTSLMRPTYTITSFAIDQKWAEYAKYVAEPWRMEAVSMLHFQQNLVIVFKKGYKKNCIAIGTGPVSMW